MTDVLYRIPLDADTISEARSVGMNLSKTAREYLISVINERRTRPNATVNISVRVDKEILDEAKRLGINVSETMRKGIEKNLWKNIY